MVSIQIMLSNDNRLCRLQNLRNAFIRKSLCEISLKLHQILYHVVKLLLTIEILTYLE